MKHKIKVTVISRIARKYYVNPKAEVCPCYNVGDLFLKEMEKRIIFDT